MILGCVNEHLAVDGTKQPREEQSLLAAGADGLRLLACGCTRSAALANRLSAMTCC